MGNRPDKKILDVEEINKLREVLTDTEILKRYSTGYQNLINQCGRRNKVGIPSIRKERTRKSGIQYNITVKPEKPSKEPVKMPLPTVSFVVPEIKPYWMDENIVEIGTSACNAFYEKLLSK